MIIVYSPQLPTPYNTITPSSQVQLLHGTRYLLRLYQIHLSLHLEVLYVFHSITLNNYCMSITIAVLYIYIYY